MERQLLLLFFSVSLLLAFTQHTCTGPLLKLDHESKLIPRSATKNAFTDSFKNIIFPEPIEFEADRLDIFTIAYNIITDVIADKCKDLKVYFFI